MRNLFSLCSVIIADKALKDVHKYAVNAAKLGPGFDHFLTLQVTLQLCISLRSFASRTQSPEYPTLSSFISMSNNTYENDIRFIWEAPDAYDNGEVDENPRAIVEQESGQPMLPDKVTAIHQQLDDYLRPIDAFMQALIERYHPRLFVSLRTHLTHLEGLMAAYAT